MSATDALVYLCRAFSSGGGFLAKPLFWRAFLACFYITNNTCLHPQHNMPTRVLQWHSRRDCDAITTHGGICPFSDFYSLLTQMVTVLHSSLHFEMWCNFWILCGVKSCWMLCISFFISFAKPLAAGTVVIEVSVFTLEREQEMYQYNLHHHLMRSVCVDGF